LFFTQAVTLATGLQQFVGLATTDAGFGGDNTCGDNQHIVAAEKFNIMFLESLGESFLDRNSPD
jgi:hypothetical protein